MGADHDFMIIGVVRELWSRVHWENQKKSLERREKKGLEAVERRKK